MSFVCDICFNQTPLQIPTEPLTSTVRTVAKDLYLLAELPSGLFSALEPLLRWLARMAIPHLSVAQMNQRVTGN